MKVNRSNQLQSTDITSIGIEEGYMNLTTPIIDHYSRLVAAYASYTPVVAN